MPIIDIQRRMVEVGRIRAGHRVVAQGGRTRPAKLETWRLTSRDRQRLDEAQKQWGGSVVPWPEREGEWELITDAAELPIAILPGQSFSQWYELWGSLGERKPVQCLRRCDGRREMLSDQPCLCPDTAEEHNRLAQEGKACKVTTHVSVMLPTLVGLGHWRLTSHGWNAAVELAGSISLLERVSVRAGHPVGARLLLDQRRQVVDGQTVRFAVPVITVDVSLEELLAPQMLGAPEPEQPALEAGHEPAASSGVSPAEGVAAADRQSQPAARTSRSAEPIGSIDDDDEDWEAGLVPVDPDAPPPGGPPIPAPSAPTHHPPGADASAEGDTSLQADGAPPADETGGNQPLAGAGALPIAGPRMANDRQRRLLFATARERGIENEDLKRILREVTGQESSNAIPSERFEEVLGVVRSIEKPAV